MSKFSKINFLILFSLIILFNFSLVLAADSPVPIGNRISGELANAGKTAGYTENTQPAKSFVATLVGIINVLLTIVGVVFLLLIIYAGYLWMTAQGNEEQIKKAKKILTGALIGIIIILAARVVTEFVITQFGGALES